MDVSHHEGTLLLPVRSLNISLNFPCASAREPEVKKAARGNGHRSHAQDVSSHYPPRNTGMTQEITWRARGPAWGKDIPSCRRRIRRSWRWPWSCRGWRRRGGSLSGRDAGSRFSSMMVVWGWLLPRYVLAIRRDIPEDEPFKVFCGFFRGTGGGPRPTDCLPGKAVGG